LQRLSGFEESDSGWKIARFSGALWYLRKHRFPVWFGATDVQLAVQQPPQGLCMDSQKADVESSPPPSSLRLRDWWGVAILIGAAWWGYDRHGESQHRLPTGEARSVRGLSSDSVAAPAIAEDVAQGVAANSGDLPEDESALSPQEKQVLGVWRDFYRGERTLTLHADGTGSMVVRLAGVAKKLFAETLEFDLAWGFEDGRLVMSTVAGRPASKFEVIRKLYGDRADYEVLEVSPDQMRLRDAGGKTEYDWRRPEKLYEDVALDDQSDF